MQILGFLVLCALAYAHDYSDIDTKFNFEPLMTDTASLKSQVDCYLDRGPCDDISAHYKRHISEEIQDTCQECSEKLMHNIKTYLKELKSVFPEDYELFRNKYDPEGKKFDDIEAKVQSY